MTDMLGTLRTLLMLVPILAACGSGSGGAGGDAAAGRDGGELLACTDVAGSRLSPSRITTPDGVDVRWAWADAGRGEDCTFTPAGDGALRCWPAAASATASTLRYLDKECTQPVVELASCSPARYARVASGACGAFDLRALGAETTATILYDSDERGCAEALFASGTVYPVGEPIAWTSFVVGQEAPSTAGSRLTSPIIHGDDGSTQACPDRTQGIHDGTLDATCTLRTSADGSLRCLPDPAPKTGSFTDAACTIPLMDLAPVCGVEPQPYAHQTSSTGCGAIAVHGVDPLEEGATTYANALLTCDVEERPSERVGGRIGAELPPETFAKLAQIASTPGRRLTPRTLATSDGFARFQGAFLDEALGGVRCLPGLADDGALRCLPDIVSVRQGFSDPECKLPIEYVLVTCTDLTPRLAHKLDATTCPGTSTYHRIGAATPVYVAGLPSCALAGSATQETRAVLDVVPPADLAPLTELRETP